MYRWGRAACCRTFRVFVLFVLMSGMIVPPATALPAPATITGTVTNGSVPLAGIYCLAYWRDPYSGSWSPAGYAFTNASGVYTITDQIVGDYRVAFEDAGKTYATEYYENTYEFSEATTVTVGGGDTASGIDATMQTGGAIYGLVRNTSGSGINLAEAVAYRKSSTGSWGVYSWYNTTAAGGYSLTGLAPGDYRIYFNDNNNQIYLPEWYDDVLTPSEATTLTVTQGSSTSGIIGVLVAGSSIEGTVTNSGAAGIENVHVETRYWNPLTATWVTTGSDQTDATGFYRVTGLRPGTYHVRFVDAANYYVEKWYDDVRLESEAASVTVVEAVPTTGVSAVMSAAGHITGRVTSDGSTGIGGIVIDVYRVEGQAYGTYGVSFGTSSDGTYNVGGLVDGSYYLRFSDETGVYLEEFYNNVGDIGSATAIAATEGATIGDIDVVLDTLVGDSYEDDDVVGSATPITVDGVGQDHTFHANGEHDWLAFRARSGHDYRVETYATWANCDTYIDLYAQDGATLLAQNAESGVGQFAGLTYTPSVDATYTIDVHGQYVDSLGMYGVRVKDLTDVTASVSTSSDDGSWHAGAVDVSITATDGVDGAGVSGIYVRTDGEAPTVSVEEAYDGGSIHFADEGISPLKYLSRDLAGNVETVHFDEVRIDLTDPESTATASGAWSAAPIEVEIAAEDPLGSSGSAESGSSGVATSYYRIGAGAQAVYTSPFSVSLEGETTVEYWSVDVAGNEESHGAITTRRDTTGPVLSDDHIATYANTASVVLGAIDAGCGTSEITWTLDGQEGKADGTSTTVSCSGLGQHTLVYGAEDELGNHAAAKSISFVIERSGVDADYVSIAGSNRYATAIAASEEAYPTGSDSVVIATGTNWPDALGGSTLAGAVDGPLLLTQPATLPDIVVAEIVRLGAKNAYILGGTAAVSQEVEDALRARMTGSVTRIAGTNRYSTANQVADEAIRLQGSEFGGVAYVATGENFPDALGASPLAASSGTPILLTAPNGVPYLPAQVKSAVILGGDAAVTSVTEIAVRNALGTSNVVRIGGSDRYDTAACIADHGIAHGMHWDGVGVATGLDFPDALSGGAMLGHRGSVLLLTKPTSLVTSASQRLSENKRMIREVCFIGGTGAVSPEVREYVLYLLE